MIRANLKSGATGLKTGEFIKYDQTDTTVTGGSLTNDLYAPNSGHQIITIIGIDGYTTATASLSSPNNIYVFNDKDDVEFLPVTANTAVDISGFSYLVIETGNTNWNVQFA